MLTNRELTLELVANARHLVEHKYAWPAIARATSGESLASVALEPVTVRPRKADVEVLQLALAWVPRPVG